MDDLLPPPARPGRPMPWRALGALFVPAAALAAGTGLQRFFEGPIPPGDALLRWMLWSTGAGLLAGILGGLALQKKKLFFFFWAAYGAGAPWAVAGLVAGAVAAVRPVREGLADQREQACRASGRSVCTVPEFTAACAEASRDPGRSSLREPQQKLCDTQGCTFRWVYPGPFRPETRTVPGALLCSVVADPAGKGVRYALIRASEIPP